jgi:hypothetical protein
LTALRIRRQIPKSGNGVGSPRSSARQLCQGNVDEEDLLPRRDPLAQRIGTRGGPIACGHIARCLGAQREHGLGVGLSGLQFTGGESLDRTPQSIARAVPIALFKIELAENELRVWCIDDIAAGRRKLRDLVESGSSRVARRRDRSPPVRR